MSERYDYCTYVDCDEVAKQHQELYESDGKHFVAEFYPYLGTVMVMALYDSSFEETPTPSESTEQAVSPAPAADTDNQSLGGEA